MSVETVRRYAEAGKIPTAVVLPSGRRRFRWSDVLDALDLDASLSGETP